MCCFVNFLVLVVSLCAEIFSHPTTTTSAPIKNIDSITELGKNIEKIVQGSPEIKSLDLAYNHISELGPYIFCNNSYKAINNIKLNQNKISNISLLAFRGLKQLKFVDLADNNVTTLDAYTFKFNTKLEKLDLSNNKINFDRLQVFLVSQSLESLFIAQNNIEQIYELTFMGLPNLKSLMLDNNILFMLSPNSFKPLNKLQYLSLANTGVYRLSESMFNNLPRTIDLQGTPLSKRFDPPLKKVTNNAVKSLITIDKYIFINDTLPTKS